MKRIRACFIPVLVVVAFVAPAAAQSSSADERGREVSPGGTDAAFRDVGRSLTGFGGAYIDSDGTPYVWLTNPSESELLRARSALAQRLGPEFSRDGYRARKAQYTFDQLSDWHGRAAEALARVEGAVLTDINDRTNHLTVGVENREESKEAVSAELRRQGIPEQAVEIEEMSPFTFASSVRDSHRPMVGGLQIAFQAAIGIIISNQCTLGVIGVRDGVSGFVTASHCSRNQGEVDNGRYWQPTRPIFDTGQVGTETVDPPYDVVSFNGAPCPSGRECRLADANFVAKHADVTVSKGNIARPALNSTNWDGTSTFRITSETNPTSGTVTKVGYETGRTAGSIDRTCVTILSGSSDKAFFCQNIANAGVDLGDSGSPVFKITNAPSTNDVSLVGILWGKNQAGTQFTYSQWDLVQADLAGTLTTCASGFSC